ncbi:HNH endonuclease [Vibrio splendidus]
MANLVAYEDLLLEKVNQYDGLHRAQKCGSFWDTKGDAELTRLKKHIKDFYILSQDYTCVYCRQKMVVEHNAVWDTEHIVPKSTHPQFLFKPENLCVACKDCNGKKSNKNVLVNNKKQSFSIDMQDYLIVHPHFDNYDEHIRLVSESLMFIPRTDKGLYTIETCGLLRFIYKFSNYANIPLEIKQRSLEINQQLMKSNTPMEDHYLWSLLQSMIDKGKLLALEREIA